MVGGIGYFYAVGPEIPFDITDRRSNWCAYPTKVARLYGVRDKLGQVKWDNICFGTRFKTTEQRPIEFEEKEQNQKKILK